MKKEKIRVLVCDDDNLTLGLNQRCVELISKKRKQEVIVYSFQQYDMSIEYLIKSRQIDMAILDFDISCGNGINIAKSIQQENLQIPIIFVANYGEYKSLTGDVMAIGFLDKPLNPAQFEIYYLRALALVESEKRKRKQRFIELYVDKKSVLVRIEDIVCLEKVQRMVEFSTSKGAYLVNGTLSGYRKRLGSNFLKISGSGVVNKKKILSMKDDRLQLSNGTQKIIGRPYRKQVKDRCNSRQIHKKQFNSCLLC